MADLYRALAPLGRVLLLAVAIEAVLLLVEMLLVHAVGQRAIAASMITAPRSSTAMLGAATVLVRIAAHALFPALCTFLLALKATRKFLS